MANLGTADGSAQSDREEIQSILLNRIRGLNEAIEAAEPASYDDEHLQLRRHRELSTLAQKYRLFIKDSDLDEMQDELALLQEVTDVTEDDR